MLGDFFRNPLSLSLLAVVLGVSLAVGAETHYVAQFPALVPNVARNIAGALVTAGVFGAIFEYFGRRSLIATAVQSAVGQTKTILLGVSDFENSADKIAYKDDIKSSQKLIVSSRFSTSFIARHKVEVRKRAESGKKITLIRMTNNTALSILPGFRPHEEIEIYVRRVFPKCIKCFSVKEFSGNLNFNFVLVDRGIWVKMYWNSEKHDFPPAFFIESGSALHRDFLADVEGVLRNSKAVAL